VQLHEGDPSRCVVLLPGIRYYSQGPLLWYSREVAQAGGWSVVEVDERAPQGEDPMAWMRARAEEALAATDADRVVVIGKSLGSTAAPLAAERGLAAVWLTPLLDRSLVVDALAATRSPALLIGSPADPTWADGAVPDNELLEVLELPGLDHSLQVSGDPRASLDVLGTVTGRVGDFLGRLA
jgi:pimeloyl-ACP methyl ester carboxylesterase